MRCLLLIVALITTLPAGAQMNDPSKSHYFLVGRFGEICTMCEVVVLCRAGDEDLGETVIPDAGDFTLYYIQTRTFWSQIATIWEWFVSNFDGLAIDGHERPVWVYQVSAGSWNGPEVVAARVTLEPPLIAVGSHSIERIDRRWQQEPGAQPVGYCQRMPLWESIEVIDAQGLGEPR